MQKLAAVLSIALWLLLVRICYGGSLEEDIKHTPQYKAADIFSDRKGLAEKTGRALDNIVALAVIELRNKKSPYAATLEREWSSMRGVVQSELMGRPVGDHPGIEWLLNAHFYIEFILGEETCRLIRTHDLWVLAHTIPVVFWCEDKVDFPEYLMHFNPLSGVVSYWLTYGTCVGVSMGTGFVFVCGFSAQAVEAITVNFIAPVFAKGSYKTFCKD